MNLEISQPERLDDSSFKITISGNDYEYQISEDKDIDKVIDKINTWLERGPEANGGLYDYIKRSFKLIGPYEEPITEEEPVEDNPEVDLPSDTTDTDEIVDETNMLEFDVHIDEQDVSISLNDWTGSFTIIDNDEDFVDILHENINEEMTLKDRTNLLIQLIRNLDADDLTDYYNLINLILNNEVDIVDDIDKVEEPVEEESEDVDLDVSNGLDDAEPESDTEEPVEETEPEELNASEHFETKIIINEDDSETTWASYGKPINIDMHDQDLQEPVQIYNNEADTESEELTLDILIDNEAFIEDLINLDLSLFKITKDNDILYFIGGINNKGNKFSLSYNNNETVELTNQFDELKNLDSCLNNIGDLSVVTAYIEKLLNFVYNKDLKGDYNEGA